MIIRTIIYFNPLKVLLPISFVIGLAGLLVLIYSILVLNRVMDITVIVLLLTSIQLGVLAFMFVAAGWIGNMFVLFSLGGLCEKIIGRKRYLWFYLVSGIISGLAFVLLAYFFGNTDLGARVFGSPLIPAVGASGAIFAIAGLFMVLTPKLKFMIIFLPFFSLPAYIMIPLVLFVTWIISSGVGVGIGNTAHFGGFLAGVIFGLYLRNKYKRKTKLIANYFSG